MDKITGGKMLNALKLCVRDVVCVFVMGILSITIGVFFPILLLFDHLRGYKYNSISEHWPWEKEFWDRF